MRIKSTHPESQGEFVEIGDDDFNPDIHVAFDEETAPAKRGRKPKAE